VANIAKQAEVAERRAKAIQLRIQGAKWDDIAAECGYRSKANAHEDVRRALTERREQLGLAVDEHREMLLAELEAMRAAAWKVLETRHLTVSHGRVITVTEKDPQTEEERTVKLEDDGPVLQAIATLLRIQERQARLLGLDSAVKVDAGMTVTYVIEGVDMQALR